MTVPLVERLNSCHKSHSGKIIFLHVVVFRLSPLTRAERDQVPPLRECS